MDVVRIPVPTETRSPDGRTNAYLLGDSVLVDPADRHERIDRTLPDGGPEHLVVTHTHSDHVGGVAAYADGATVWAHADHRERFRDRTGVEPDELFRDGDAVGPATVLETPGHAPDHVALELPDGVAVGDLAVADGSVVVGAPEGDMAAYLNSLRRVRDRGPDRLYPGHGPVIDDPKATVDRLIDHRLDRERRVLVAVEDGARTPREVTDAAYEKDLTGVYDLARATVVAHLEKLAGEGRVEFDGDRVRPA